MLPAYPRYLSGLVQALVPVPGLTDFVVEAVSNAFGRLPDPVLLPWLPTLIKALRAEGAELAPLLIREAGRTFPGTLPALDAWVPPWIAGAGDRPVAARRRSPGSAGSPVAALLLAHPEACDAAAALIGSVGEWRGDGDAGLVAQHPETALAVQGLLGVS